MEWSAVFAFSVDFLDTRVFPDYELLDPTGTLHQDAFGNHFWYELGEYDPTDIYNGQTYLDGETIIGLSENTDIDAIQFTSLSIAGIIDGLFFQSTVMHRKRWMLGVTNLIRVASTGHG